MLIRKIDAKPPSGENREGTGVAGFAFDPADLKILSGAMTSLVGALERVIVEVSVNQANIRKERSC